MTTANQLAGIINPATGQIYDANAPSGSVIQVVQTATSSLFTSNGSEVSVLNLTITPSSASSRILITANSTYVDNRAAGRDMWIIYKRNSTVLNIDTAANYTFYFYQANGQTQVPFSGTFLDSPATTSTITYRVAIYGNSLITMAGCHFILMEIAG